MTRVKMILEICGENIHNCMQCGKCSASCPAASDMDLLPHQVMRFLQVGSVEKIANSQGIWNCASCFTCASRCPRGIDVSKIMEAIRLTRLRLKGNLVLNVDELSEKIDDLMPQQALVSVFRKYSK